MVLTHKLRITFTAKSNHKATNNLLSSGSGYNIQNWK